MANSLSINITADTASLRAQLAIAQAQVSAYGSQLRSLASQMQSTGAAQAGLQGQLLQAAQGYNQAAAQAASFRSQLNAHHQSTQSSIISLGELKEGLLEVGKVFGIGFGAEKIVESVKALAEMGERTENIAAAIGTTPAKYSELSAALQLVGGDADAAQRAIRQFEKNIETALENPKSPAALNLGALGLGDRAQLEDAQKDIIGFITGPVADAYNKFVVNSSNPGTGTAEFTRLLGKSMQELVPGIKEGSAGFAELIKRAHELGSALTETQIKELADTGKKIHELEGAFTGLKVAIYEGFRDPINDSLTSVTNWATDTKERVKEVKQVLDTIKGAENFLNYAAGGGAAKDFDEWIKEHSGSNFWKRLGIGGESGSEASALIPEASAPIPELRRGVGERGAADRHDESLFNPTDEERALLDRIKQRESSGQYDILHGPGRQHISDLSAFPRWAGFMGPEGISHAAGGYGFQPGTYADIAKRTGRPDFSPESQDINALALLRQKGTAPWPWLASEGGGKNVTPAPLPVRQATEDLKEDIRLIEDEIKLKEKDFELERINARDDQTKLNDINARKRAFEEEALVRKQLAITEAGSRTEGLVTGDTTDIQARLKGSANEARREEIRLQEEAARINISKLETDRRIGDAQEQTSLRRVEGERRTGDLTIDAAAQAAQRIVQAHASADAQILAKEEELAQGSKKLSAEVASRKEELAAKSAEKIKQIEDKASEEHAARAHAIDAEIASTLSSAIVNTAWGKGGGIGQQISGFVQSQEKKALDVVGTKLLDASGVGKLFEGIGDKLFSFLPGAASGAAAQAPVVAAITTQTAALTTAQTASTTAIVGAIETSGALQFAKPSVLGTSLLGGGVIPSAAGGMTVNDGKGGTLAVLHPQEMVLPKNLSLGIQNAISRGNGWSIPTAPSPNSASPNLAGGRQGGDTHITHNWDIDGVLSTHDFQRLLMAHSDTIARAGARASRNFDPHAAR